MTFRDTSIHRIVLGITVLFALAALVGPRWLEAAQYLLLAAGTILIGIPHGATDNYLFERTARRRGGRAMVLFYGGYVAIALVYGLFWLVAPTVSLVVFLLISVYHFGQSNLFYTALPEDAGRKKLIYLTWGAFNLASPLLFRYDQAAPVIRYLIGYDPIPVATAQAIAPWASLGLLATNVAILTVLRRRGLLGRRDYLKELSGFGALFLLYATAPLYVSFIVYWAFWHSVNSAIEIATTWTGRSAREQIRQFYRSALPLTVVTFAGMGAIFALAGVLGNRDALVGVFFVIIAAITLPHTLVMERLYREKA